MIAAPSFTTDWRFQLFELAFMATVAIIPRFVIYAFSLGKVRQLSRTGVAVLRLIGGISALSLLYSLAVHLIH